MVYSCGSCGDVIAIFMVWCGEVVMMIKMMAVVAISKRDIKPINTKSKNGGTSEVNVWPLENPLVFSDPWPGSKEGRNSGT